MSEGMDRRKLKRLQRKERERERRAGILSQVAIDRLAVRFEALDTWFFRESRPHNAVGGSELASLFPPPVRTLTGAFRTLVGESHGADWAKFVDENDCPLREVLGDRDSLKPLELDGPWLRCHDVFLFPAPAFLVSMGEGRERIVKRLCIGAITETDLGRVHLPEVPGREIGYKPLDRAWLTADGMKEVLAGGLPKDGHLITAADLFQEEPRLGIARDNSRRTAKEQMLYQTRHIRPYPGLAVELGVSGLELTYRPMQNSVVRLGGEGRLASVKYLPATDPIQDLKPKLKKGVSGLVLVLLTSADLATPANLNGHWLPPGFEREDLNGVHCWRGEIVGVPLLLHAAALSKASREGGWDQALNQPRSVRSFLPAGSAWYCTVANGDLATALARLHGAQVGCDKSKPWGRGRLAAGLWPLDEFPDKENPR